MSLGNILLRLLKAAFPLAMLYVGKEIIDEVIHLTENPTSSQQYLWLLVAIELALVLASEALNRAIILLDSLLGDLVSNSTSEHLIRHAATLDLDMFEDATFYDKLERARRQTNGRTILMSQVLSQFQDILTILFLAGGLAAFNPWLILLLFIAVVPSFMGETYFNQRSYSLTRNWTPERRELDYLRYIGASDVTAKEVKIFNLADFIASRFSEISQRYYNANKQLSMRRAAWGGVLAGLGSLAYYGAYVLILTQTVGGLLTIGTLTFLAGSFQRMQNLLQAIMVRFSRIAEAALYLQDLFDFFELKPEMRSRSGVKALPIPIKVGFTFENLGFKYRQSEQWALRNVSFHLPAGQRLALVGENGAGKTTLVKLLSRLYEPTEGRILLDGVDIREYNADSYNAAIGVIFQDYQRFQLKVSENIAVGNIEALTEDARIRDAARKSLADKLVESLPAGYEQLLGKRFETGVELSGGQWQKIALARAYMRDAQVYILDEPTAALDARAEYEVFQRFADLIRGKMAVLISHRFSTVRMADLILVLDNGKLLELGTHEELLAANGKYAELFTLQAQGYV